MPLDPGTPPKFPSRYCNLVKMGEGADGVVYLAKDIDKNQAVVIKALKTKEETILRQFYNEFNTVKNCKHPSIIRAYDFCEFDELVFFTMEYVEGQSFDQIISESNSFLEISLVIDYLFQIAQGLYYIHQQKMIHRDLKPSNILITKDNKIKLLDFGIARFEQNNFNHTATDINQGSRPYMSPEQRACAKLDCCTDVYSFGVMAFEMLTTKLPYQSDASYDLKMQHAFDDIPSPAKLNPQIPTWLDSMVQTCMEKKKTRRYQSMLEIIAVIVQHSPNLPVDENLNDKLALLQKKSVLNRHNKNKQEDAKEERRHILKRISLVLTMVAFFMLLWVSPVGSYANATLLRTLFTLGGRDPIPKDIVIVALDDLSYQYFGVSTLKPFPRKYWAEALEKIHATKPKVVIIDGYIQPDNSDEEGNSALESAIGQGPTVLMKWQKKNRSLPKELQDSTNTLKYYNDPRFSKAALLEIEPFVAAYNGIVMEIGLDLENATSINEQIPIRAALSKAGIDNLAEPNSNQYINFYGEPNKIKSISMYEVISRDLNFKDKIVFMGYKSLGRTEVPGMFDLFDTSGSFWDQYFGVEIHATVAGNLIENNYIKRLPKNIENNFLMFFAGLFFLFLVSKPPKIAFYSIIIALSVWIISTIAAFNLYRLLLPGLFLIIPFSVIVCAGVWYNYGNTLAADLAEAEKRTNMKLRHRQ